MLSAHLTRPELTSSAFALHGSATILESRDEHHDKSAVFVWKYARRGSNSIAAALGFASKSTMLPCFPTGFRYSTIVRSPCAVSPRSAMKTVTFRAALRAPLASWLKYSLKRQYFPSLSPHHFCVVTILRWA